MSLVWFISFGWVAYSCSSKITFSLFKQRCPCWSLSIKIGSRHVTMDFMAIIILIACILAFLIIASEDFR